MSGTSDGVVVQAASRSINGKSISAKLLEVGKGWWGCHALPRIAAVYLEPRGVGSSVIVTSEARGRKQKRAQRSKSGGVKSPAAAHRATAVLLDPENKTGISVTSEEEVTILTSTIHGKRGYLVQRHRIYPLVLLTPTYLALRARVISIFSNCWNKTHLVERHGLYPRRQRGRVGEDGVVPDGVHAEVHAPRGHLPSDPPETHHPNRLPHLLP